MEDTTISTYFAHHKPYVRICMAASGKPYLRYIPCLKEEKDLTAPKSFFDKNAQAWVTPVAKPKVNPPPKGKGWYDSSGSYHEG